MHITGMTWLCKFRILGLGIGIRGLGLEIRCMFQVNDVDIRMNMQLIE